MASCGPLAIPPDQKYNSLGAPHVSYRSHSFQLTWGEPTHGLTGFYSINTSNDTIPLSSCLYITIYIGNCQQLNWPLSKLIHECSQSVTYMQHYHGPQYTSAIISRANINPNITPTAAPLRKALPISSVITLNSSQRRLLHAHAMPCILCTLS